MGSSAKVILPSHIAADKLLNVISKVMACEYTKSFLSDNNIKDENAPCSNKNSWVINFKSSLDTRNYPMLGLSINTIIDEKYYWYLHVENEDEEPHKELSGGSNPVFLAVAKRVVDFFGGTLIYTDYDDQDDSYTNLHPKFAKKTPEETSNDRFYKYYNLLNEEPILTAQEIKDMEKYASYNIDDKTVRLMDYLEKYKTYTDIKGKIDTAEITTQSKTKHKI